MKDLLPSRMFQAAQEHWALQLVRKESDQAEILKSLPTTPIERNSFRSGMHHLCQEIGINIANYHLISDDTSGRIPTLILAEWQHRVKQENGYSTKDNQPHIDFVLASRRVDNWGKIRDFVAQNQKRLQAQPNLLVTDFIDHGTAIDKVVGAFDLYKIPLDLAILSHYSPKSEYQDLTKNHQIYWGEVNASSFRLLGDSAGSAVRGQTSWSGVEHPKSIGELNYYPDRVEPDRRNRAQERLVREQIKVFANLIPLPRNRNQ